MSVDLGLLLKSGLDAWRRNRNLCVPFILNFFLTIAAALVFVMILVFAFFGDVLPALAFNATNESSAALIGETVMPRLRNALFPLAIGAGIFAVIVTALSSFFDAGATGMASKALSGGKCTVDDMVKAGSKRFLSVFAARLVIYALVSIGAVFLVAGFLVYGGNPAVDIDKILSSPSPERPNVFIGMLPKLAPLLVGAFAWAMYAVVITILFSLVVYSIVVDETSSLGGIKKALGVFMKNKLDVLLLWLFTTSVFVSLWFVSEVIFQVPVAGIAWVIVHYSILLFVLQPLYAV